MIWAHTQGDLKLFRAAKDMTTTLSTTGPYDLGLIQELGLVARVVIKEAYMAYVTCYVLHGVEYLVYDIRVCFFSQG